MQADQKLRFPGNGTRCVAAWAVETRRGSEVQVVTGAGEKECMLLRRGEHDFEFMVEMGHAEVLGERSIAIPEGQARGLVISTGNPHFVEFVEGFAPKWQERAAAHGECSQLPQRANAEIVCAFWSFKLELTTLESGGGGTRTSGTGCCA